MAEPARPLSIGERVAFYRRQQRLTQHGLAQKLNRSVGWIRNIEQGRRQVDSTTVILELAAALGVEPNKLTGRPLFAPPSGPKMPQPNHVLLDLRRVLLHYNGIHGLQVADELAPRPVRELRRLVAAAEQAHHTRQDNFSAVVWQLPGLIREARRAVQHAEGAADQRQAWAALAGFYRVSAWSLWQYGDDTLGWIAADRLIAAAERADDPLLIAAGARTMQQFLLTQGYLSAM